MIERSRHWWLAALVVLLAMVSIAPGRAQQAPDPPASDFLNAVLWMQRSVEYKANALTAFALARIRLDQALADKDWAAAPKEPTGPHPTPPPATPPGRGQLHPSQPGPPTRGGCPRPYPRRAGCAA